MLMQKLVYVSEVGASAVLYVLIVLSVVSIGVIIERWWYFRKRRFDLASASTALAKSLRAHDVEGARASLKQSPALEAQIIGEALEAYEDGPESLQEILQKAIRQRRKSFEGGLLFLGTLGNNAPFVGLFGTVLGVVAAFRELGNSQAAMASGGGMGNVMGGIAEALIATGIGIMVALPAVISYNIFQKKGADVEEQSNALGNIVMAAMKSTRLGRPSRPSRADETADDEDGSPSISRLGAEA